MTHEYASAAAAVSAENRYS